MSPSRTVAVCARCEQRRLVQGRGLCQTCYSWVAYHHQLEDWPRTQMRGCDVVEEVEFLLRSGEPVESIPGRLGMKAASIARALYRCGRADLGRPFERMVKRDRQRTLRTSA